jgi:DNA repair photolyase
MTERSFGAILAYDIFYDEQFRRGREGTVLLMGGLADPFQSKNRAVTLAFIDTIRNLECENVIHIATRYGINDESAIEQIARYKNILMNYSVSRMLKKSFGEAAGV